MRFAITGTDARFLPLRKLLLADGHEITDPASADMVISPPWDPSARYARREEYQIAIARLTAEGGAIPRSSGYIECSCMGGAEPRPYGVHLALRPFYPRASGLPSSSAAVSSSPR